MDLSSNSTAWLSQGSAWILNTLPYLPRSQGHFGVGRLAELGQLCQNINQLICQGGVTATELVLNIKRTENA